MKNLLLTAVLLLGATSVYAQTEISRESDGDLEVTIHAQLEESFRITVENADMVGIGDLGDLALGKGGMFDGLKTLASLPACKLNTDAAPVYATPLPSHAATTCDASGTSLADGMFYFDVQLGYKVEIGGAAAVDLSVAIQPGPYGVNFLNGQVDIDGAHSVLGKVNADTGVINWSGDMPMNGLYDVANELKSSNFEDLVVINVSKQ